MQLQNQRGGRVVLQDIKKPTMDDWGDALEAIQVALELEKDESLQELWDIAAKHNDSQVQDFIEGNYLHERVETIKKLGDYVTQLKDVGTGHGEWHFDRSLKS